MNKHRKKHYAVIGGGLAGLSTAYFLSYLTRKSPYTISLYESASRFGGWIRSTQNPSTGAFYDLGPHSARIGSTTTSLLLRLALHVGLGDSLKWLTTEKKQNDRYMFIDGRLLKIPIADIFPPRPFTRSPLGLLVRRVMASKPVDDYRHDMSIDEFFRSRLDDEFADYIGSAMIRGIFAGDTHQLSARACLPQMFEAERRGRNLLHGMLLLSINPPQASLPIAINSLLPSCTDIHPSNAVAWSLMGGMQRLTDSIVAILNNSQSSPQTNLHLDSRVDTLRPDFDTGGFQLAVMNERTNETSDVHADEVFICTPSYRTAGMLTPAAFPDSIVQRIQSEAIPWADVAVVIIELAGRVMPPFPGFGHLVPPSEDADILGVIYDSVCFAHLNGFGDRSGAPTTRYTVMMKPLDRWMAPPLGHDDDLSIYDHEIEGLALHTLERHLGIVKPKLVGRYIHLCRACIPQYPVGHNANVDAFRHGILQSLPTEMGSKVHFVGASYDGVSLGDVVLSAANAMKTFSDTDGLM